MLKKILLPLLMAAVVLPQSVSAAIIPNGTSRARGMVATQNSLSVSEKAAIKKLFTKMENAVNRGDLQAFLNLCSQETTGGLSAQQYKTFKSNMRAALALNKAYGVKFSLRNLKISDIEGNQAIVLVKYQYDISPEIMDELNAEQRQSIKKLNRWVEYLVKKENGRWLITWARWFDQPTETRTATTTATPDKPVGTKNQQQERKVLQALFKKHIQALNKEDLQAYLATLDPKSAQYQEAQAQTQKLFKEYDLKYEVETIEVISIGQQNAVVKMVATVKKIKGGSFADSKIIAYNTLRKTSQGWRIADTQIESVNALASR
jgi:ketosteroid isomerase-like protein